jgi:hypothetical protein
MSRNPSARAPTSRLYSPPPSNPTTPTGHFNFNVYKFELDEETEQRHENLFRNLGQDFPSQRNRDRAAWQADARQWEMDTKYGREDNLIREEGAARNEALRRKWKTKLNEIVKDRRRL